MNKFKSMTDQQKVEYLENKLRQLTFDLFAKTITKEYFKEKFQKYSIPLRHYQKKLKQPDLFYDENTEEKDQNELLTITLNTP